MNAPQGSAEWMQARLGKATASRVADILAATKSGPAASRKNYLAQLVIERLTGEPADTYQNAAMAWGIEKEPEARAAYAFMQDVDVQECGFIEHPRIPMAGASPDGLVGDDGMVEIKCPNSATHIETLLRKKADPRYEPQMQFQMAVAGRSWCDWVSYDPRMPDDLRLFVTRVQRDDKRIAEIEAAVVEFLGEVSATVEALRGRE